MAKKKLSEGDILKRKMKFLAEFKELLSKHNVQIEFDANYDSRDYGKEYEFDIKFGGFWCELDSEDGAINADTIDRKQTKLLEIALGKGKIK